MGLKAEVIGLFHVEVDEFGLQCSEECGYLTFVGFTVF